MKFMATKKRTCLYFSPIFLLCWIQESGFVILDPGCKKQDPGFEISILDLQQGIFLRRSC
jgi:hypothetical protein